MSVVDIPVVELVDNRKGSRFAKLDFEGTSRRPHTADAPWPPPSRSVPGLHPSRFV